MSLWFIMALMTAAAAFAVLLPLARRQSLAGGSDVAVYRDQLAEVDRDVNAGLIAEREAESAKVEIGRRLIAAAGAPATPVDAPAGGAARRRLVAVLALILIPAGAVGLYAHLGSPSQPSATFAARDKTPPEARSINSLVAQVEAHLQNNPEDGRGWEVLAPVYLRLGRYDDAVRALRASLRLNGATAAREADLGEALVYAANGVVTAEAGAAFQRAIALDAKENKARHFIALALEQEGKLEQAAAAWRALLADAPPGAPWIETVKRAIARVAPNGPTGEDVAVAEQLPPDQRAEMIRGMVARLAERLAQDGNDPDGWLRLIRAYVVLSEPDKAREAAHAARKAVGGNTAALERIEALVKSLGLET